MSVHEKQRRITMQQISFTGRYVRTTPILKNNAQKYRTAQASIVELDIHDKNDMKALSDVSKIWKDSYVELIADDAKLAIENEGDKTFRPVHIYVSTSQMKNFEKVKPTKILGAIEISEKDENFNKLELLQVKPDILAKRGKSPAYRHVGKGLVSSVQELFNQLPMKVDSVRDAIGFYENCGFVHDISHKRKNALIWNI
jgi:hypothetical protein